jgi:hypothetical protein
MAIQLKNILLRGTKAPNLPTSPTGYDSRFQEQFSNALRLYFTEIDNFSQAMAIPLSGTTAQRPVQSLQVPLQIGQYYYDTTLDRPIFWNGTVWKKADGTTV